jgi:predicted TIM-barrel fold metal-dependent hydrolase
MNGRPLRAAPGAHEALITTTAVVLAALGAVGLAAPAPARTPPLPGTFNDNHLHLTNYIQQGIDIRQMLGMMGSTVGRAAIFGIPLQQEWSYRVTGNFAPKYYLDTDAPLYYYSFTDAQIAMAYRSLAREQQARFDPMITGFNPADMYAADHIRRVLETFPGVFSGIGEFSIHKEFVSPKVAGSVASLTDPALDRLLDFAAEVGLVVLLHNDADMPFAKTGADPVYLAQLKALFRRHPRNTIIWAHLGVGRVVHPVEDHAAMVRGILDDPGLSHVLFDLSWSEAAKYLVASAATTQLAAGVIESHPDRFLFGTDALAPPDRKSYLQVFEQYAPLWQRLDAGASEKVRRLNYERVYDQARRRVRAWERSNVRLAAAATGG